MKIALAQIDPTPTDFAANVSLHLETIAAARAQQVNLIVFPELSLSGDGTQGDPAQMTISLDDERFQALVEASTEMDIVVGVLEADDGKRYNSAVYLQDGAIRHVHRKVFLATYATFFEDEFCVPGRGIHVFDTAAGRTNLLICNDIWHPLLPYMAGMHGTEIMLAPSNSAWSTQADQLKIAETWESLNRAYAGSLGVFLIFVNRVGARHVKGKDLQYWGGSEIIAPGGELLAKAAYNDAELLVFDIDLTLAQRQQQDADIFRDFDISAMQAEFDHAVTAMQARREGLKQEG